MQFLKLLAAIAIGLLTRNVFASPIAVDGNWPDWGVDPSSGQWTASQEERIFHEDFLGSTAAGYLGHGFGGQFFYEGSLDVATVGGADKLAGIHWTMNCGNDVGEGWDRITPIAEPASFAILGIGLVWMTGLRRRLRAAWKIDSGGQTRTPSGPSLRSLILDFCRSRLTSRRPQP